MSKYHKSFKNEFNSYMKGIKPSDKLINDTLLLLQQEQQKLDCQKVKSKQNRILLLLTKPNFRRYGALACTVLLSLFAVKLYSSVSIEELPTQIDTSTSVTTTELTTSNSNDSLEFTKFSTDISYLTGDDDLNISDTNLISSYESDISSSLQTDTQKVSVTSTTSSGLVTITVPSTNQTEVARFDTSSNYGTSISITNTEDDVIHTTISNTYDTDSSFTSQSSIDSNVTKPTMTTKPLITTISSNISTTKPLITSTISSNISTTKPLITTTTSSVIDIDDEPSISTSKPPIITTIPSLVTTTITTNEGQDISCTTVQEPTDGDFVTTTNLENETDNSIGAGQGGNSNALITTTSVENTIEYPCTTGDDIPVPVTSSNNTTSQTSYSVSSSKITTIQPSQPAGEPDEYYTPIDINDFGFGSVQTYPFTAVRFLLKNDDNGYYHDGYVDIIRILQNFPHTEYIPFVGSIVTLGTYDDYCDILIIYDCTYNELCSFIDEFYRTITVDTKNELITPLICESFSISGDQTIEDTQYILDYLIVDDISLNDGLITDVTKKLQYLK
ncbi:MAG: hypothetical protein ACI4WH_05475 [Oscillospiraceae bacterium]